MLPGIRLLPASLPLIGLEVRATQRFQGIASATALPALMSRSGAFSRLQPIEPVTETSKQGRAGASLKVKMVSGDTFCAQKYALAWEAVVPAIRLYVCR